MKKKLKIGVSACLIGLKYRYDGQSRINRELIERLADKVDLVPVCPEVELGMEIPRPKLHLTASARGTRLKEIEAGTDHTDEFAVWVEGKLEQLDAMDMAAFLFKSRSPSCGLRTTKVFSPDGGKCISEHSNGIFASRLTHRFPWMIVGDDEHLDEFIHKLGLDE